MRELAVVDDPAWPAVAEALRSAGPSTHVIPIEREAGERCLHRLQVTARSTLGALALNTGGVTVGHGWMRLLGGGGDGLVDLATANGLADPSSASPSPPVLVVAYDVLGGCFAINGGGLPGTLGEVHYWAPDSLRWEPIGSGHTDLVHWSVTAGLDAFYADLRWSGWEREVAVVPLDFGLGVYPPLCMAESRPLESATRQPVPWSELRGFLTTLAQQLDALERPG